MLLLVSILATFCKLYNTLSVKCKGIALQKGGYIKDIPLIIKLKPIVGVEQMLKNVKILHKVIYICK